MTVVLGKMGSSSGWRNNGFSGADLTPPGGCVEGGKVAEGCLRMDRFFFLVLTSPPNIENKGGDILNS